MKHRVIYLTPVKRAAVRRGARDELREHFPRACAVPGSRRCKRAKRTARRLASDHVVLYGAAYYPAPTRRRKLLRGKGCCNGGCAV